MPLHAHPQRALNHATLYWIAMTLAQMVHSHALPRPTSTVALREFEVELWPLEPTNAPLAGDDLLRRQFNTICGYIGGDLALPATCSAGSHCAADSQHGVIGCCPDVGPCTQGIFTGCVDRNSDAQTEINPYIFTCSGSNVCYQNKFEGGLVQYGCGSASSLANTVARAPSGAAALSIASVSVELTAPATSLPAPTTIGSRTRARTTETTSETQETSSSSSRTSISQESSTSSETATTSSSSSARSSSSSPPSVATDTASAPKNENKGANVGAIVGGAVGGIAGLAVILTLAIWCWRRRSRNSRRGPGLDQNTEYIPSPMTDNRQQFLQLPTTWEEPEPEPSPRFPRTYGGAGSTAVPGAYSQQYPPNSSGAAVGGSRPYEPDRQPLTRELDDFSQGFNTAVDDIEGNDEVQPNSQVMGTYKRSRGDGGPLWQQNRQTRNLMWI